MNCRHFGKCGSCGLYDMSYDEQLKQKGEKISKYLKPYYDEKLCVFDSPKSHYRARAEFRIWHDGDVCSYAMGDISKKGAITIQECPKIIKAIENRMWKLLAFINDSFELSHRLFSVEFLATTTDECLVTMLYHKKLDESWSLKAKELENVLDISLMGRSRKQKVLLSQEFVTEALTIDDNIYKYRYYESGFTQPNPSVNVNMIEWAVERARGVCSGDLLESYCGLGNFTIPLSKLFTKVLATEISKTSIKSAKENCKLNNVDNIEFIRLSSEEMTQALNKEREFRRLSEVDLDSYTFSCVLVDPPRAGLDRDTIELISKIDNIIYISCNPETLSRDLELLTHTHRVDKAAMFDQFPHTNHIESGVFMQKIRGDRSE